MHPLSSAVVVLCGLLVSAVPAAFAGTCAMPDERLDCTRTCGSLNECLHCCTRTGGAPSSCKAECLVLPAIPVRRPPRLTRPPRPTRPPRVVPTPPSIDLGRFTATCRLEEIPDGLIVHLRVDNGTGGDLRSLTPHQPFVQLEAGTKFVLGKVSNPRSHPVLAAGGSATFQWQGRMSSSGAVGISAGVSAVTANGQFIDTPQVDCGAFAPEQPTAPPLATPTAAISDAARCAGCHTRPVEAFIASKWSESDHASYRAIAANASCVPCHSPLQTGVAGASNATIAQSQWQGVTCSACHASKAQRTEWGTPIAKYDAATGSYQPVPLWDADELCKNCHTGKYAQTFTGYGLVMHEAAVRCIDCHMAKIPGDDPSIGQVAAHDFKVEANLPYSCGTVPGGCHVRRPEVWARRIMGLGPMHP